LAAGLRRAPERSSATAGRYRSRRSIVVVEQELWRPRRGGAITGADAQQMRSAVGIDHQRGPTQTDRADVAERRLVTAMFDRSCPITAGDTHVAVGKLSRFPEKFDLPLCKRRVIAIDAGSKEPIPWNRRGTGLSTLRDSIRTAGPRPALSASWRRWIRAEGVRGVGRRHAHARLLSGGRDLARLRKAQPRGLELWTGAPADPQRRRLPAGRGALATLTT
jgi:hypothetical protein